MKSLLLILCASSILFGAPQEELALEQAEAIEALDPKLLAQPPISQEEMQVPAPRFEQRRKSSALAVGLTALFPGLGHVYLEDKATASGLMGTTFLGLSAVSLSQSNDQALSNSIVALQNTWSYGLYAAYRDVRLFNGNAGYSYQMPTDSFADLSLAPFRWKILKKPEVWGGFLGAMALAAGTTYLFHKTEARLPALSSSGFNQLSPLIAFPIGLGEESLFRGYLQSQLAETFGPQGGIVLSALAFGAMHIPNALVLEPEDRKQYYAYSLPLITALGAYFGYLTYKNHSLQESVALHSWYDFTLFAISAMATQTASTGRPGFALAIPF